MEQEEDMGLIGGVNDLRYAGEVDEILAIGMYGIAVVKPDETVLSVLTPEEPNRIIGADHTPAGWQVLVHEEGGLVNYRHESDGWQSVTLNAGDEEPGSAVWSPQGDRVAVGFLYGGMASFDVETGHVDVSIRVAWTTEEEPINPLEHWLHDWSRCGRYVLGRVGSFLGGSIVVWDLAERKPRLLARL